MEPKETPQLDISEDQSSETDFASKVVLYNDDWHTFDEVIMQLIKAVNCNYEQARALAFQVHVKGQAIVFNGTMDLCLKVSGILEEIALHTQIIT